MRVAILGTHGIPARHGGFETFAERLALHLVSRGWEVTVYCPELRGREVRETRWNGVRLLHLPVTRDDALGTIYFDWTSTVHAVRVEGTVLNLGYGSALFGILYRLRGVYNLINMDGIEWRRRKWSFPAKIWLYLNERLACWFACHLIADHPEIARHLATRVSQNKITMIPYGADEVTEADSSIPAAYGLEPGRYALVVARPDPDNSILEIVEAFSSRTRGLKLVVLGAYNSEKVEYHRRVIEAAGPEVVFPGGIYEKRAIESLRFHCCLYIHGHQVGGTNPSLVEALAAGSAVLAHDNLYNRWVVGDAGRYFSSCSELAAQLETLLEDAPKMNDMAAKSRERHRNAFEWEGVLGQYEQLITRFQADRS